MHKTLTLIFTLSLPVLAASPGSASAPDEAPLPVKYAVTRAAPGSPTLLAGELSLRPNRRTVVEHRSAEGPELQSLDLEFQPLVDGVLIIHIGWTDVTAEGERVRWNSSVKVKRGDGTKVSLDFPGGGRLLKLTAG